MMKPGTHPAPFSPNTVNFREPWLRVTQLSRGFQAQPAAQQPSFVPNASYMITKLGQYPLSAPSVFNFYLPNYQSPGVVTERNAKRDRRHDPAR